MPNENRYLVVRIIEVEASSKSEAYYAAMRSEMRLGCPTFIMAATKINIAACSAAIAGVPEYIEPEYTEAEDN